MQLSPTAYKHVSSSLCDHACAPLAASDLQAQGVHASTTTVRCSNILKLGARMDQAHPSEGVMETV